MSGRSTSPDDEGLLRNVVGVASERPRDGLPAAPSLEAVIGANVRALRGHARISASELAGRTGMSKAMLWKIENAQTSCSLGTLQRLAVGLDVPVTTLVRGIDADRPAAFTPAGAGPRIVRAGSRAGHEYELLGALRGEHKRLESLMVTLLQDSETYPQFQHPGTEFLHVLTGEMRYAHSSAVYHLRPGDSLQFDGEGAHGPVELIVLPVKFLSVIAFPDDAV